jgi:hypothetical protein
MTTLEYEKQCDESPPEPEPEPKPAECWYCGADLESELLRNREAALELLSHIISPEPEQVEALGQGLLCTACMEKMECPNSGAIGGESPMLRTAMIR